MYYKIRATTVRFQNKTAHVDSLGSAFLFLVRVTVRDFSWLWCHGECSAKPLATLWLLSAHSAGSPSLRWTPPVCGRALLRQRTAHALGSAPAYSSPVNSESTPSLQPGGVLALMPSQGFHFHLKCARRCELLPLFCAVMWLQCSVR